MATANKTAARKTARAGAGKAGEQAKVAKGTSRAARDETARPAAAKSLASPLTPVRSGQAKSVHAKGTNGATPPAPVSRKGAATAPAAGTRAAQGKASRIESVGEGEVVRKSRTTSVKEPAVSVQTGILEPAVTRPDYWDRACADLVRRDRILKKLIPQFGPCTLPCAAIRSSRSRVRWSASRSRSRPRRLSGSA